MTPSADISLRSKCAYYWNSEIPFILFPFLFLHFVFLTLPLAVRWTYEAPVCCQAAQNNHDPIICMMIDCHRFVRQSNTEIESRAQPQWTLRNDDCSFGIPIKLCIPHDIYFFFLFAKWDFHSKMIFNKIVCMWDTKIQTIKIRCKNHISTFYLCYKIAFDVFFVSRMFICFCMCMCVYLTNQALSRSAKRSTQSARKRTWMRVKQNKWMDERTNERKKKIHIWCEERKKTNAQIIHWAY